MTDLVVGCPIYRRDWVIREWLDHLVKACSTVDLDPYLVFVGDPDSDPETFDELHRHSPYDYAVMVVREDGTGGGRDWNVAARIHRMVDLRNQLLRGVREIDPQFFLSLDSDILINDAALGLMIDETDRWGAVGSRAYMSSGVAAPSYAMVQWAGGLRRPDATGTFQVDVIMAIKLMTKAAYSVDYEFHRHGEDIGWSKACAERGVKLGWVGEVCSKHVMTPEALAIVDKRCGY